MVFGEDKVIHMDLACSFPRNYNRHPEKFVMFKEMVGDSPLAFSFQR